MYATSEFVVPRSIPTTRSKSATALSSGRTRAAGFFYCRREPESSVQMPAAGMMMLGGGFAPYARRCPDRFDADSQPALQRCLRRDRVAGKGAWLYPARG